MRVWAHNCLIAHTIGFCGIEHLGTEQQISSDSVLPKSCTGLAEYCLGIPASYSLAYDRYDECDTQQDQGPPA